MSNNKIAVLPINGKQLKYDIEDQEFIINSKTRKITNIKEDEYKMLYSLKDSKKQYLANQIFGKKIIGYNTIKFLDGDNYNYCKSNITFDTIKLPPSGIIIKNLEGVKALSGKYKNVEVNFGYHVKELDNSEFVYMHIKNDIWTKIDLDLWNHIKKYKDVQLTWNYNNRNFIEAVFTVGTIKYSIALHRYIYTIKNKLEDFPCIKHLNEDKLDNRIVNLGLVTDNNTINQIVENTDYDYKKLEEHIKLNYKILSFNEGHSNTSGHKANKLLNPFWKVKDSSNNIYYLMFCAPNHFCKISLEDINFVTSNNYTWHVLVGGYAICKSQYMHRIILQNLEPNYDTTLSVDHINRDKLDNRRENLRWATQSLQNSNQDKRSRKQNAQHLPKEIENVQLPKYTYYAKEIYNKDTGATREFFRIEKHPKLESKCWSSSKSSKLSILDKLEETKKKLYELDNDVQEEVSEEFVLPIGVRINENKARNNRELVLDWRTEKLRYNLKMVYNENISLKDNFNVFKAKIKKKYPEFDKQNAQEI